MAPGGLADHRQRVSASRAETPAGPAIRFHRYTDCNPWVAQAMIHARGTHVLGLGLKEMLIGEDPLNPEALWEKMYTGSFMTGRRGLGMCAIGAIDMALWDVHGKALTAPCWPFLG